MIYCDSTFDRWITDKYYDTLAPLSPVARAAEKFRLELEELPIHLLPGDRFVGRFGFETPLDVAAAKEIPYLPEPGEQEALAFPQSIGSSVDFDRAHTLADYERLLQNGLVCYEEKIAAQLRLYPDDAYLLAMQKTLLAVRAFVERIICFLQDKMAGAAEDEKARLADMCSLLRQVPFYPAETFTQALQSIWLLHFLLPLSENAWYSISLGRLDRYLYPYYEKARREGVSRQQLKEELHYFYRLLNSYSDGACLLNVGPDYNELSCLLVECQRDFGLPGPILGARVGAATQDDAWDMLIDEKLFAAGQPTFYSEEGCRRALQVRGVSSEEINRFANNSCMSIGVPGREIDNMWGCVFSVSSALEMAVNSGRLLRDGGSLSALTSMEELWAAFEKYCRSNLRRCLAAYELLARRFGSFYPNPFWTLLLEGCIEKKQDRAFSAPYHNATVECMGMVNTSDGLYAIDTLVFRQRKYTLEQMAQAVRDDFVGHEALHRDILRCSKYGTNTDADSYAVRTAQILAGCIAACDHDNVHFLPSLHTLDANVRYGAVWGAGFDGRRSGAPFAKNAGPCDAARESDPTSVVLSAAKLPQSLFHGGQPIDILFSHDKLTEKKPQIAALIRTYLQTGGLQFQVNAVSSAILRDALAHPERHNDLIVRIGGFSDYFNRFSEQTKREFISRFEREEGICPQ